MRRTYIQWFLGGVMMALFMLICLTSCDETDKSGSPFVTAPPGSGVQVTQNAADDAKAHVASLQADLAAAKVISEQKTKEAVQSKEDADHAPLIAILHIAEALGLLAILLGGVEFVITRIWTLGVGAKLGEFLILSGVAILILSGLLQTALEYAKIILAISCIPIGVVGYVWLKRMGMLSTVATDATQAVHGAANTLKNLGHSAAAEALLLEHKAVAAEHGVVDWVEKELAKIHVIKAPVATTPAAPAVPAPAPAPKV